VDLDLQGGKKRVFNSFFVSDMNTKQKKIIVGYDTPFIHECIDDMTTHFTGPGLGDILRGMLALTDYCIGKDIIIEYCFTNHPISKYLIPKKERTSINFLQFTLQAQGQQKDWITLYKWIDAFIENPNEDTLRCQFTGIPYTCIQAGDSVLYSDARWFSELSISKMQKTLQFSDEIQSEVQEKLQTLELQEKNFNVLHIRLADIKFSDFNSGGIPFSSISRGLKLLKMNPKETIVMSNNNELNEQLSHRFGFKYNKVNSIHLGMFNDDTEDNDKRIKETICDFILMSKSSKIIQMSDYYWGSGFSDICAVLYGIPIERLNL
jgi:hypothetical protein